MTASFLFFLFVFLFFGWMVLHLARRSLVWSAWEGTGGEALFPGRAVIRRGSSLKEGGAPEALAPLAKRCRKVERGTRKYYVRRMVALKRRGCSCRCKLWRRALTLSGSHIPYCRLGTGVEKKMSLIKKTRRVLAGTSVLLLPFSSLLLREFWECPCVL